MISIFSNPAFATDPDISVNDTGSGMCVYDVLDTYSGAAGFKANWEANNIKLRWYNGNTLITPGNDSANDCDYNGGLNVPSNTLTRTGYTFSGWTKRPEYNFATLTVSQDGTHHWSHNNGDVCRQGTTGMGDSVSCSSNNAFAELGQYEFRTQFSWGDIYGSAYCSAKSGNGGSNSWNNDSSNWLATYDELGSATGTKQYCWCQLTGYKPTGTTTLYRPISVSVPSVYVFCRDRDTASGCAHYCAANCGLYLLRENNFREKLFMHR